MTGTLAGGRCRSVGPPIHGVGGRRVLGLVGLAILVAMLVASGPARVGAHTELLQGSPGPGQRVGGTVDFIDLVFLAPVTDVELTLRGPGGEVKGGEMVVADGQIIRYRMDDALTTPGRYVVEYQMVSDDGDLTEAGYFFLYDEDAFEPARLGAGDVPDPPLVTLPRALAAAAVVILGSACVVLLGRVRRTRAALAAHREEHRAEG